MPSVCFYFQVHQPNRLRKYTIFDINQSHFYEDVEANSGIMQKVASKCYLPTNQMMLDLINKHQGKFKIAYSISGTAIEQMKKYSPETLESFKKLVDTGCVELISETFYHSLSVIFSKEEFIEQVRKHQNLIFEEFGQRPTTFRNTELIYNNYVAECARELGFKTILAEGADKVLSWRSPNYVYKPAFSDDIKLLLRNYPLSDDIAFRFSNQAWESYPLVAPTFASWVHKLDGAGQTINLFMDYETFGEHQWEDCGIFDFMRALPDEILKHPQFDFKTPGQVTYEHQAVADLDVPDYVSWADMERDLTAWLGNHIQDDSIEAVYKLRDKVYRTEDSNMISTWQSLTTSDHFYYMCTKWFSDGDVHKYFNPYESPYEAYINFQNVLRDFEKTVDDILEQKKNEKVRI
jgi:alpha-amylase